MGAGYALKFVKRAGYIELLDPDPLEVTTNANGDAALDDLKNLSPGAIDEGLRRILENPDDSS